MVIANNRFFFNTNISSIRPSKLKNKIQKRNFSDNRPLIFILIISLSLNLIFIFLKPKKINLNNFFNFFIQIQGKLPLLYFIISWFTLFVVFEFHNLQLELLKITMFLGYANYLKNIYLNEKATPKTKKDLAELLDLSLFWLITDIILLLGLYLLIQKLALVYIFFFKFFRKTTYLISINKNDEAKLTYNLALLFFILKHMDEFTQNAISLKKKDIKKFNQGNFFYFRNLFYNFPIKHKILLSSILFLITETLIIIFFG